MITADEAKRRTLESQNAERVKAVLALISTHIDVASGEGKYCVSIYSQIKPLPQVEQDVILAILKNAGFTINHYIGEVLIGWNP